MPDKESYLTKEKYDALIKELETLKTDKRREIAESLEYSKSLGDLSKTPENYDSLSIIVYSLPSQTNIKKTPDLTEIAIPGENPLEFVKSLIGKVLVKKQKIKESLFNQF